MLKIGRYNVCVLDLITESRTGKLSSVKIGSVAGQVFLTYKFCQIDNPTPEQMACYGAIMGGTYLFRRWIDKGDSNAKPTPTVIE
jgi:hypothetical protein